MKLLTVLLVLLPVGDLFHDRVAAFVGCFTHYLGVDQLIMQNFLVLSEVLKLQLRKDGIVLQVTLCW